VAEAEQVGLPVVRQRIGVTEDKAYELVVQQFGLSAGPVSRRWNNSDSTPALQSNSTSFQPAARGRAGRR
jgi:hypothetical protein